MSDLVAWVSQQIDESDLPDDVGLTVLAALEGEDELEEFLGGGAAPDRLAPRDEGERVEAGGTFLTSIAVEGFRGIGPKATLEVNPAPGLTIMPAATGPGSPRSPRRRRHLREALGERRHHPGVGHLGLTRSTRSSSA